MATKKRTNRTSKTHAAGRTTKRAMTHQEQLEAILASRRPEIVRMAKGHLDVWYRDVKLHG